MINAKIKCGILLCCFPMRFLIFSLVFLMFSMMFANSRCCFVISVFDYSNLDAIIRVRMLLCEIRVSNYVRLNPGLQRARPLWPGASAKLIMPILPAQKKIMLMAEVARKLPSNI